jgi:SAM-dependent methyltransferase
LKKSLFNVYRRLNLALRAEYHEQEFLKGCTGVVLDAGCGGGDEHLLQYGHVVGVDLSHAALHYARTVYPQVIQSGLEGLPFADRTFDVIVCRHVLEHLPHDTKERTLAELRRVLKDEGVLVITVPVRGNNIVLRRAGRFPEEIQRQWVEGYGHHGWESVAEMRQRLKQSGWSIDTARAAYTAIWPIGEYRQHLGTGFDNLPVFLQRLVRVDAWLYRRPVVLRKILNCLRGVLSSIYDTFQPLDAATVMVVKCGKADSPQRAQSTQRGQI